MELATLPLELRRLVENYNSYWGASVRLWEKRDANADDIARSDEYSEKAGETEERIKAYCTEHSINFAEVQNLMGSDK